jgi:hypothetical protein
MSYVIALIHYRFVRFKTGYYDLLKDKYYRPLDAGLCDDGFVELSGGDIIVMPLKLETHAGYSSEVGEDLRSL